MTTKETAISEAIDRIKAKRFSSRVLLRRARRGKRISINVRNVALEAEINHTTIYRARDRSLAIIERAKSSHQDDPNALRAEIRKLRLEKAQLEKTVKQLATKSAFLALANDRVMHELKKDKKREARIRKNNFLSE